MCILTNACNFNEYQQLACVAKSMGEMFLYNIMHSLWIAFATSLRMQDLHTGVFQFHIGKTANNY